MDERATCGICGKEHATIKELFSHTCSPVSDWARCDGCKKRLKECGCSPHGGKFHGFPGTSGVEQS